ncbi:box C/D snoRNA protein 1-like protein [Dinothrombium tinctorium]|uniref:Box C/D snoRNA protein 1-like protein n=1 Tax=Dinothrombium tinctorium TaxID=1965070 RepID=A0A3S3NY99_9ACAR|nr:box C/D snoRNA protein 1-like protein [Dinothrombium tinctorium]RWS05579.1 box C/D snoRNA protein 1-like protein [Dinothrombium tinctorium]RWS05913.1 box C/D snoRNA protein 1-like protein [Dinothrombium tinctorium]
MNEEQNECNEQPLFGMFGIADDSGGHLNVNDNDGVNYRQNMCLICGFKPSKYRCPCCEANTCSLNCCKMHKIQFDCNGLRNRIQFKRLSDFDQKQFLDDYFFLEDTDRSIDAFRRDKRNIVKSLETLPPWLKKLRYEARVHEQGEAKPFTCVDHRVAENITIGKVLEKYVKPNNDCEWQKKFALYQSAGFKSICVLLKLQINKYLEIELSNTVAEALNGKTIIEFPTFYVVLKDAKHEFEIVDEDEMAQIERDMQERAYKKLKTNHPSECYNYSDNGDLGNLITSDQ